MNCPYCCKDLGRRGTGFNERIPICFECGVQFWDEKERWTRPSNNPARKWIMAPPECLLVCEGSSREVAR